MMAHNFDRLARVGLPLSWMIATFILSSVPDYGAPQSAMQTALHWVVPEVQNLLHIPLFGGLCLCWLWALKEWELGFTLTSMIAFGLTVVYGGFDEWYQLSIPGRYGSATDLLLNTLGAAVAVFFARHRHLTEQKISRKPNDKKH